MKIDTKSVSFQILTWLTDTDRHQFRVGSHVTNTRLVWEIQVCVTNQTKCQSCLPVCSSKPLPPSRGEKTDIDIDLSSTVQYRQSSARFFLCEIFLNPPASKACSCRSTSTATNKSVECGLHYQKHYPWVIDLCITSHIQSLCLGVWVVFGAEEISY